MAFNEPWPETVYQVKALSPEDTVLAWFGFSRDDIDYKTLVKDTRTIHSMSTTHKDFDVAVLIRCSNNTGRTTQMRLWTKSELSKLSSVAFQHEIDTLVGLD